MAVDDLSAPLGQEQLRKKRKFALRLPISAVQALAAVLGLFLLGFLGFALFNSNPFGGEPLVRVAIDPSKLPAHRQRSQRLWPRLRPNRQSLRRRRLANARSQ